MNAIRNLRLGTRPMLTALVLALGLTIAFLIASTTPASARSVSAGTRTNVASAPAGSARSGFSPGAVYLVVMVAGGGVAFTGRRLHIRDFD